MFFTAILKEPLCSRRIAVPMFLSTKLLPRSGGELPDETDTEQDVEGGEMNLDDVERFNESLHDMSAKYSAAADRVLRRLLTSGKTR